MAFTTKIQQVALFPVNNLSTDNDKTILHTSLFLA